MALTKEKLQEIIDAGGIDLLLSLIGTSVEGVNAQEAMDAKQGRLTLLWTNANPGDSFAGQAVSWAEADIDYVEVFAIYSTASTTRLQSTGKMLVGQTGVIRVGTSAGNSTFSSRDVTAIAVDGVTFGGGYTGGSAGNSYAVPVYIYGGKF